MVYEPVTCDLAARDLVARDLAARDLAAHDLAAHDLVRDPGDTHDSTVV
ncbi:MAG: hypothetical protein ACYC6N_07550 [Pirellulaceae bacterium]